MLTDYHVHLRPDEPGTTAELYFTTANAERYRTAASERGIAELGVSEHVYRFEQALDVWQHPFWQANAREDLDAYCEFVREQTDLTLGIEADFVPGGEDRMASLLEARDFDYVIGSVHFLRDEAVDMEDYSVWDRSHSPEEIWRRYFETLGEAARSGLFDILAHPDLVKVWGRRSPAPGRRPAPLLRAGDRRDRRVGDRDRGLHRGAAQARRRSCIRRRRSWRCAWKPARRWRSPATRTGPRTSAPITSRRWSCWTAAGVQELCVFERRERRLESIDPEPNQDRHPPSDEPRGDRIRLAPPGEGSPADPGRGGDPRRRARVGGAFRRGRADPCGDRRAARRGRLGRHRRALPRHRRALARRRLAGAARERRRHG